MTYATVDDLIVYAGVPASTEVPPRILTRASLQVDNALVGARYDTAPDGSPLDSDVSDALRDATCAQARALLVDDTTAVLVAEAWDLLRSAGLLPTNVRVTG